MSILNYILQTSIVLILLSIRIRIDLTDIYNKLQHSLELFQRISNLNNTSNGLHQRQLLDNKYSARN